MARISAEDWSAEWQKDERVGKNATEKPIVDAFRYDAIRVLRRQPYCPSTSSCGCSIQAIANHKFDRRQFGYGHTMINLAHD